MSRPGAQRVRSRRFKEEFVQAFQDREQARSRGRKITVEQLAQKFTPAAYDRNPASAMRGMGAALKRIERDKKRLESLGSASPSQPGERKYER
jgi:hypothetical protein